ncbi:MAG TPA: hypothetical protein VF461_17965 [Gemmatimonadaceae bacterium]
MLTGALAPHAGAQVNRGRQIAVSSLLGGGTCTVLDVRLRFPDSVLVSVPSKRCGPAELVVVGQPKLTTFDSQGGYTRWRPLSIQVAVRNVGSAAFPSPIELRLDSITPVYRGTQLSQRTTPLFFDFPKIWPNYYSNPNAVFGAPSDSTRGLAPGERSRALGMVFGLLPQTDRFRVWVDLRRAGVRPAYPASPAVPHPPRDDKPLGADVDSFIARARLPLERERQALFRMPEYDLLLFSVTFGTAQDCLAGCFYSGALGLEFGRKIGWLDVKHYVSDTLQRVPWQRSAFTPSSEDTYLLSPAFLDTVNTVFGRHSYVSNSILEMMLASPRLPRATLKQLVSRLADVPDEYLAERLVNHPRVTGDPELLLMLASLPTTESTDWKVRQQARDALLPYANALIADPSTSARTLFLLATCVPIFGHPWDSLPEHLSRHPNARDNLAIQLVTHPSANWQAPTQWAGIRTMIRASPRVRSALDRYIRGTDGPVANFAIAAALLADPETGRNPDVLLVLANLGPNEVVAWEATRRLPPTELLRPEQYYMPAPVQRR